MKHFTKATLMAILSVIALTCFVCFVSCTNVDNTPKADTYYLSTSSTGWETYDTASSVPSSVLFAKSGDVYTLTAELEENEQISVNKVGTGAVSVDLFSTRTELEPADNNRFTATLPGTYTLTLEVEGETYTLDYAYSAPVESVTIDTAVTSLGVGETYTFAATVNFVGGTTGHDVVWSSSNPAVLTVSEDGEVEAIAEGSADLTATAGGKSATVTITVSNAPAEPTSIKLNYDEVVIDKSATLQLTATVLPENVPEEDKDILWQTDNATVATVGQDGVVKATTTSGTAKITAKLTNYANIVAECTVKVREPVTGISTAPAVDVVIGTPQLVAVTFQPTNSTVHDITATVVSGEQYVKAEEDPETHGVLLTGLEQGKAEVIVTSKDNPEATCNFSVTVHPEGYVSVVLDVTDFTLNWSLSNQHVTVHATLSGAVEAKSYEWIGTSNLRLAAGSSTSNYVVVYPKGFGLGEFRCKVTTTDGNTYESAPVKVTVTANTFYIIGLGGEYEGIVATEANSLVSVSENTYALTRHFNVGDDIRILYTGMSSGTGDWWDYGMMGGSRNFDYNSPAQDYLTVTGDNISVKEAGEYTVTLDLTGPKAYISVALVSLDITSIAVAPQEGSSSSLKVGETESTVLQATITPASHVNYQLSDVKWSIGTNYSTYLTLNPDGLTCTVTIAEEAVIPEDGVTIPVTCAINGKSGSFELQVMPEGVQKVPVSSITFAQDHYIKSIATTSAWTQTVKASVNADATVKGVTYSVDEGYGDAVSVGSTSGIVTAKKFGTYTVKATANDDPEYTTTTRVTFYPTYLQLTGDHNGWKYSTSATMKEVADSNKEKWELTGVEFTAQKKFRLVWCTSKSSTGMQWSAGLGYDYLASESDNATSSGDSDHNILITKSGTYNVTLDLSRGVARVIVKLTASAEMPTDPFYTSVALVLAEQDISTGYLSACTVASISSRQFNPADPDTMKVTLTVNGSHKLLSGYGWPGLMIVVGGDDGTWYNGTTPLAFEVGGDKYKTSKTDGYWTVWTLESGANSCVIGYEGTMSDDYTCTFTITLNGDHTVKSVSID